MTISTISAGPKFKLSKIQNQIIWLYPDMGVGFLFIKSCWPPPPSVGNSIPKYSNFDICGEISSSGPSHQIPLVKSVSNFPTRAKVNRKFGPKSIFPGVCLFDLVFLALFSSFMAIWDLIIILGAPKAKVHFHNLVLDKKGH